ncbi:MAG: AmiC protein [Candidatus Nomurabacteria bacterium GW2011_GWA2_41_25]|uniref:MurNAc-LAA domain-containing protein n=2 Tax=Candidatus Nomuraibacteriota TaxID=1752729 RepID=A0A1F6YCP7_9BACT|nr:MAG: AmiC protein [Candidatus Nomurabacteria bacterium GW2011_GWA2_41_25]OGI67364.1 MAG: hypothetical protein A2823_00155 [Candidatus Nomurabacteria bacterium RIFCSPHIGHO2_01_FULL_41_91]OGI80649.1 MAG: hypothetical protein A3D43_00770 [Candidatus Nomurabacteria bacterium RIFCSPHIGHO2_02_FULL_41_52]OGI84923.1 MAG: hypothetical protein A3F49_00160 [Candidatus Nomurabacteria bacterium RIFCSPHIGHO2_12_FULL_42_19]OGI93739.1 MAG: hypothetical protein A3A07_02845 [Candidatus Nomurabacteria bacteriu
MKKILLIILFLGFILIPIFFVYAQETIKILLVPGHDDEVWGAQYGNMKEADMTLALATKIYNLLKKDEKFEVYITRSSEGYTKEFADYFADRQADVVSFKENAKKEMQSKVDNGSFIQKTNPPHNRVSEDMAIRLYGFNKWANENKMDAVIHIHFNDYPRPKKWTIGKYRGFVIYIPEGQMVNWMGSGQLAANIFIQLNKKYATSNYEKELGGLTPDQTLIALGSNGTLNAGARSVLVEYGYIYEKKFRTKNTREQTYKNMAQLTVTGVKKYFFKNGP